MNETVKRLADYDIETQFEATVVGCERITAAEANEEVIEITLDVAGADFDFEVGQSIGVLAPGSAELGQKHHFRLYSVADLPERGPAGPRIKICVKRCFSIDPVSGERYPGVASNYLCDRKAGDTITIAGPYGLPFEVPADSDANLILIGSGTGIAPFRALVKHLYAGGRGTSGWNGRVLLFYGGNSGLELLYMNDKKDDFAQYYDEETFEAFQVLSPRPEWADPIAWDNELAKRGDQLWDMLGSSKTFVYVAGLEKMRDELDKVFSSIAGSPEEWQRRKAELEAGKRWVELLY